MSSYWLKIASRAEAKNRRIYKPRRFTETRCTYAAAVEEKVGALRVTHTERERDCERAAAFFPPSPTSRWSLSQEWQKKWHCVQFFNQP